MEASSLTAGERAFPRAGWNPGRRLAFLGQLATTGSVRAACASAGISREAAYRLRRRDTAFAQGWDDALAAARAKCTGTAPCCPIDGAEDVIRYRGKPVGSRRRYDSRLLLAHLGRLDRQVRDHQAEADAAIFDELLALIAGEQAEADSSPWTV